ncbi:MAG: ImmA/IrrE family metallo-endopeptidase [Jaaginema sp. PMC 1079.18]|nr:ImmA/IrrE family metallo-endopeptidase [Jaaginema sp. PMC 1080.18]MEC4850638.1 ImmA/IrrE family metallo-endopeptidase [Jaaginema sp. PMC 1079.18]MEC4866308.1 ImmA/IrrE family metallo-endopeptidase [Jaaginema sp. PMC 1078.18]
MNIFHPFRFVPKHDLECVAINIIEAMKVTSNYVPQFPLDASRVAEFLGLDVVWDSIADDADGQIAARILPLEKLIEINDRLPSLQGGFGESTIAHEIGHWVLHIDRAKVDRILRQRSRGIDIAVEPLLCRSTEQSDGIEWQAQYFAGCLLMPLDRLQNACKQRDLTQWSVLYDLAAKFGVTISNLVHRLQDLNWIEIEKQSRQIYRKDAVMVSV